MSGWIKLHRTMFDWEWFTDVPVFKLFTYLLLAANYEDNTYRGTLIKRGCLITGRRDLSIKTGLTEAQVQYALNKLRSTDESINELILTTSPQGTHIEIVKYNEYQNNHEIAPTYQSADQSADQSANQSLLKKSKNNRRKKSTTGGLTTAQPISFTDPEAQSTSQHLDKELDWSNLLKEYASDSDKGIQTKKSIQCAKDRFFKFSKDDRDYIIKLFAKYKELVSKDKMWLSSFLKEHTTIPEIENKFWGLRNQYGYKDPKPIIEYTEVDDSEYLKITKPKNLSPYIK